MENIKTTSLLPGLLLVAGLAGLASLLGQAFPLLGGAVIGVLLGIAVRWRFQPAACCDAGIRFASRQVLQWSIVALGFCLPVTEVARTGMNSLTVTLVTICAAFLSALCFGKLLQIPFKLSILIGAGTAICGGSAIAAIIPVVRPDEHETAFSFSTIFLFNIAGVLLFPLFGHLLGLSDRGFGLWAGTAINDTSSVVAAAYSWSKVAGEYATIVKLTRAMLIVPVTLLIGGWFSLRQQESFNLHALRRAVPWFIVWFVAASVAGAFLPAPITRAAHLIAPLLITAALTAVGLTTNLGKMHQTGWRPILFGMLVWLCVASSSLLVQQATGRW